MRDTTTISRPYFRESTDALATLVATRPARDVLLNVAAELVHRERPAARRLAAEVAALLGGVASIGQASKPVALPSPVEVAPLVIAGPVRDVEAAIVAAAGGDAPAKPARKPAAAKVKRPGDIGWKPRSLDQIARTAGLAPMSWDAEAHGIFGNVMLAAREFGLRARGFIFHSKDSEGYATWAWSDDRIIVGPYGALYMGDGTWRQLPRDERDAITEDGRAGVAAAVVTERLRVQRAKAKAHALLVRKMALDYRRALKPDAPQYMKDARKQKIRMAWQARAKYRAI
jgi:hypothetical protein